MNGLDLKEKTKMNITLLPSTMPITIDNKILLKLAKRNYPDRGLVMSFLIDELDLDNEDGWIDPAIVNAYVEALNDID